MLKSGLIVILSTATLQAASVKVLIAGTGCRTRQQAIERIFEKMEGVKQVTILPRRESPADNHRYFIVECAGIPPTQSELVTALGRRAKFYRILSVSSIPLPDTPKSR